MGAWGEDPFGNDVALDWLGDSGIQELVATKVDAALAHEGDYDIWRAATATLLAVGGGKDGIRLLLKAKDRLALIRADGDYIAQWADSDAFTAGVDDLIEQVDSNLVDTPSEIIEKAVRDEVIVANPSPQPDQVVKTIIGDDEVEWIWNAEAEKWRLQR